MSTQLHKNFTDDQVKSFLKSYVDKEIKISYILQMLKIKRRKFFKLLAKYRKDPDSFSIQYERKTINRKIDPDIERNIVKEVKIEKDLIKNKDIPIKWYNYSYIKDLLEQKYSQKVSLPTIIDRAKRKNFYFLRPKRKAHDREVVVNSYRKVSINTLELKVPKAPLHESIQLRIVPDKEFSLSEVRFWHKDKLLGMQKVKNGELTLVHF